MTAPPYKDPPKSCPRLEGPNGVPQITMHRLLRAKMVYTCGKDSKQRGRVTVPARFMTPLTSVPFKNQRPRL